MDSRRFCILVVDDDPSFLSVMHEFLGEKHDVFTAENGQQALESLSTHRVDLVISDVNMPGMTGPELLQRVMEVYPGVRTMLITSYSIDDYIPIARKHRFSTIMPKCVPFNFVDLEVMIEGILTQQIFGLSRYLVDCEIIGRYCIRSSLEARDVRDAVVDLFEQRVGTAGDMKLLLDETVTNAIYHAPRLPDGSEKYPELTDVTLEPGEYVHIECGVDKNRYGISVADSQGKLARDTVLDRIERQVGGQGILDDSGRGIHMSRLFSDTMVINIQRNVKTEVILMNYISMTYRGSKPLYINEV